MAKGRKQASTHHERLLGYGQSQPGGADLPDLLEEDVWPAVVADDGEDSGEEGLYGGDGGRSYDRGGRDQRWIDGGGDRPVGGLSLAFEAAAGASPPRVVHQCRNVYSSGSAKGGRHHGHGLGHQQVPSSAPVSVPDWSRILRVDSAESLQGHKAGGEGDDGEWVPPHEYLAREYAMSGRAVANSVFEGAGRTLKGRDMRRVRDAVWSQTGFFG